jgi:hypothetical protein
MTYEQYRNSTKTSSWVRLPATQKTCKKKKKKKKKAAIKKKPHHFNIK